MCCLPSQEVLSFLASPASADANEVRRAQSGSAGSMSERAWLAEHVALDSVARKRFANVLC
mgnify:CR=1 FL=1